MADLFIVTGASGVGKTAVIPELRRLLSDWDVFDVDVIRGQDWTEIKCNWLRIARSLAEGGRRTVLCGTIIPENIAACEASGSFAHIRYLNLHCDDETRAARLGARGWAPELIADHVGFARWLLDHAESHFDPPMPTIHTTDTSVLEVARQIAAWCQSFTP